MGLAYQAQLNWSLYGRTIFDLGAGRNISYSYQDTEPYYLLTNARLTVTQPLPRWFELYGGVRLGTHGLPVASRHRCRAW